MGPDSERWSCSYGLELHGWEAAISCNAFLYNLHHSLEALKQQLEHNFLIILMPNNLISCLCLLDVGRALIRTLQRALPA